MNGWDLLEHYWVTKEAQAKADAELSPEQREHWHRIVDEQLNAPDEGLHYIYSQPRYGTHEAAPCPEGDEYGLTAAAISWGLCDSRALPSVKFYGKNYHDTHIAPDDEELEEFD